MGTVCVYIVYSHRCILGLVPMKIAPNVIIVVKLPITMFVVTYFVYYLGVNLSYYNLWWNSHNLQVASSNHLLQSALETRGYSWRLSVWHQHCKKKVQLSICATHLKVWGEISIILCFGQSRKCSTSVTFRWKQSFCYHIRLQLMCSSRKYLCTPILWMDFFQVHGVRGG